MRLRVFAGFVCLFVLSSLAQDDNKNGWILNFEDYAIAEADAFQGQPAKPRIVEKNHRTFRTRILDAAEKGPNFAGRYAVAQWGCGSGCLSMALVDETTGKVFSAPFETLTMPMVSGENAHEFQGLVYQLKSRLFIADGCQEDKTCATYYYEWKNDKFGLLRVMPQPGPEQPSDSSEQ
jgi:hypothetical protein